MSVPMTSQLGKLSPKSLEKSSAWIMAQPHYCVSYTAQIPVPVPISTTFYKELLAETFLPIQQKKQQQH